MELARGYIYKRDRKRVAVFIETSESGRVSLRRESPEIERIKESKIVCLKKEREKREGERETEVVVYKKRVWANARYREGAPVLFSLALSISLPFSLVHSFAWKRRWRWWTTTRRGGTHHRQRCSHRVCLLARLLAAAALACRRADPEEEDYSGRRDFSKWGGGGPTDSSCARVIIGERRSTLVHTDRFYRNPRETQKRHKNPSGSWVCACVFPKIPLLFIIAFVCSVLEKKTPEKLKFAGQNLWPNRRLKQNRSIRIKIAIIRNNNCCDTRLMNRSTISRIFAKEKWNKFDLV